MRRMGIENGINKLEHFTAFERKSMSSLQYFFPLSILYRTLKIYLSLVAQISQIKIISSLYHLTGNKA